MISLFKFSKFLEIQERNGIVAIFHRLHPSPIYTDRNNWYSFKENPEDQNELFKTLKKQHLLIHQFRQEEKEVEKVRKQYENSRKQVMILYLILTHKCNLACKYCFVAQSFERSIDRELMMTSKIMKKGIDLWVRHVNKNFVEGSKPCVTFYGGEPLLNLPVLKLGVKYLRILQREGKLPKKDLEIVVVTNGTLIDRNMARFFKHYKVKVSISIDGPSEIHNICRITQTGMPTFDKVFTALKILRSEGIDIGASVTITPYNLSKIKDASSWLFGLGVRSFGLNELMGNTLSLLKSDMNAIQYKEQAAEAIIDCFIRAREIGLYEDRMARKVRAFTKHEFYPIDCGAYGEQIVIQPDGYVSNCHASSKYNIKHLDECDNNFWIWDEPQIKKWQSRLPMYNQDCLECPAISVCGGGCAYSAEEVEKNISAKDEAFCLHTKKAFNFLIWDLYKQVTKYERKT